MANRIESEPTFHAAARFAAGSQPQQWIFDLPSGTHWVRFVVDAASSDRILHKATIRCPDGTELLNHAWTARWLDELFLKVPAKVTHLLFEASPDSNIDVAECRLQPISRPQMAAIAVRKKLGLLRAYGCTTRVLRRGAGMLATGRWGEFRAKLFRGVADSRFIESEAATEQPPLASVESPAWARELHRMPGLIHRRVVLVTPSLKEGDAVGNDVLGMAHSLRAAGAEVHVCSRYASSLWPVLPLEQAPKLLSGTHDLLIYHHSIGFAEAVRSFKRLPCTKILKYHNITPPDLLRKQSPDLARGCEQGLAELPLLAAYADAVWVDSAFNAEDLPAGVDFEVVPPFNQIDDLMLADDEGAVVDRPGILMVGRVVPSKSIETAIDALAVHRRETDPRARLTVVGSVQSWHYLHSLKERAEERDVGDAVQFIGSVSLERLKGLYRRADAFLCTSRHEGFGLPVLEALSLGVPVVCVPNGALPSTLGGCGWLCPAIPESLARGLRLATRQSDERNVKLMLGERHYRETYTNRAIAGRLFQLAAGMRRGALVAA